MRVAYFIHWWCDEHGPESIQRISLGSKKKKIAYEDQ